MKRVLIVVMVMAMRMAPAFAAKQQCQFDDTFAKDVREAAAFGLKTIPLGKTHGIVVNAATPRAANQIAVEIIRTASCPDDAPRGVCVANPSTLTIQCSAEELEALVKGDHRAERASPALLYLITHELEHLQQGEKGRFQGKIAVIHLDGSDDAKWRELRQICQTPDADMRKLEEDADAKALVALERAADLDRYRDPLLSPQSAVYMFVERLRIAAKALDDWESAAHPEVAAPTAFVVQTLDPTPANLEQTSRRLLCQIRGAHSGILGIPNAPDTHPDAPTRLAAISVRLRQKARELPGGVLAMPPEMPDITPVERLIPTIGAISASFDLQEKEFFGKLWAHLCEHYLNSQQWPDCSPAAFHDGTPECPLLLAIFDDNEIAATPARVTLHATADGFETDGRIAAIAPRGDGALIALAEPRAVIDWSSPDHWTATSMPCEPRSVTVTKNGYAVLCTNFDHVEIDASGKLKYSKFHMARLNDRRLEPGKLEGRWIGSTAGRLIASVRIDDDDRSMAVEITRDGARSLDAWRTEGCEKLRSGFALADGDSGRGGAGITLSSLGTTEVARFTAGFGRLRDIVAPDDLQVDHDDLGPVIACGIRPTSAVACFDAAGTLFDPFAPTSTRVHLALSERFSRSNGVRGRIAAAGDRLMVAVWDNQGWELHLIRGDGHACLMHREEGTAASLELAAEPSGAVVVVDDGPRRRLIRISDCR
jgi:hypothetical protein